MLDQEDALESDPIFRLAGPYFGNPLVLGAVLFGLALAMIVFGPASESRFIYTDF